MCQTLFNRIILNHFEFYEKALTMPGVKTDAVLTHLGMSQIGKADYAAAKATLGKITGNRKPIADLWIAYAKQESGENAPAKVEEESGPSLGDLMGASS